LYDRSYSEFRIGNDPVVDTYRDKNHRSSSFVRTEPAACSPVVQRRRPPGMPGGLMVTLFWVFASSGGSSQRE
jgi:hypothetical protein